MAYLVIFIVLLIFGLTLLSCMWIEAHQNVVYRNEIQLDDLPDRLEGLRFFFISDVHRRVISEEIIKEVAGKVEFVVIGGDLMEKRVPFRRVEENIDRLKKLGPVYFVWGNNDYEDDYRKLDTLLHEKGVVVLDNTATTLEKNGETLILIGVDDCGLERDRLDLALKDTPSEGYRILLSHNPMIKDQISPEMNISFVLSGHTHGGQIRFLGWGPREKGGLKRFPGFSLLLSNGYGTTSIPLRLGAPAQTHLITLRGKKG
ncbi:MAG TPA: metallophosphoesterase [Bacillales bacterium]|nr:metallophosphoesterase [Bacillales bacterium]